jgi:hypothetical protein
MINSLNAQCILCKLTQKRECIDDTNVPHPEPMLTVNDSVSTPLDGVRGS